MWPGFGFKGPDQQKRALAFFLVAKTVNLALTLKQGGKPSASA